MSIVEAFQRGRSLSFALPAMHDSSHDPNKNVLCGVAPCSGSRCHEKDIGEGTEFFLMRKQVLIHGR